MLSQIILSQKREISGEFQGRHLFSFSTQFQLLDLEIILLTCQYTQKWSWNQIVYQNYFIPDPCIVQHTFLWLLFSRVKHEMFNFKSYIYLTEIIKDTLSDACIIKVINKCYHSWCFMQMLAEHRVQMLKKGFIFEQKNLILSNFYANNLCICIYYKRS